MKFYSFLFKKCENSCKKLQDFLYNSTVMNFKCSRIRYVNWISLLRRHRSKGLKALLRRLYTVIHRYTCVLRGAKKAKIVKTNEKNVQKSYNIYCPKIEGKKWRKLCKNCVNFVGKFAHKTWKIIRKLISKVSDQSDLVSTISRAQTQN